MPSARDLKRALDRVRSAIPAQRKLEGDRRNIRLGLERITRAIQKEQKWIGVHVGGTNGKGSICTLLSHMFRLSGLSHGLFTSPAVIGERHGIMINGMYPNKRLYESEIHNVQSRFEKAASGWTFQTGEDPGPLTPFELDTAVAFRIFNTLRVKYGVIEVGMGGASDATNAMHEKGVTVISKIGLDHQEYLGNTIEEIAAVKAGIMRPFVPCIIDHTNSVDVLRVLTNHARSIGAPYYLTDDAADLLSPLDTEQFQLEDYEKQNLLCALFAFKKLLPEMEIDINRLLARRPYPPGRKDQIYVRDLTNGLRENPVFVDGAHNMLGVQALSSYVNNQMRQGDEPVTWIMGLSASKSKPFASLIETLVQPQDRFAFVEYQPLPNEPSAVPAELGREIAEFVVSSSEQVYDGDPSIDAALKWACEKAGNEGTVVVTGSLYLIRELLSTEGVFTKRKFKTMRPGRSQLWYYTQLAQRRELTEEEAREFKQARRHWRLNPIRSAAIGSEELEQPRILREVTEETKDAQRRAAYHSSQAASYTQVIGSIELDTENGVPTIAAEKAAKAGRKAAPAHADMLPTLQELMRRQGEHIAAYQQAMHELRGYKTPIPELKFLSYQQIYGRPPDSYKRKRKAPQQDIQEEAQEGEQSVESQSVESQSVESKSVESQSVESQSVDSQSVDSPAESQLQPPEGQNVNGSESKSQT